MSAFHGSFFLLNNGVNYFREVTLCLLEMHGVYKVVQQSNQWFADEDN